MSELKNDSMRVKVKDYIPSLQFEFEEFDKDAYDGSYYERDGKLSDLFWQDDICEAISEDAEKYVDEMNDDEIEDIIGNLVNTLDCGAIKMLKIFDGDKVLWEESNDKPYED